MRKTLITISIAVSSILFCASAAVAGPRAVKGELDPARSEAVSAPAGEASAESQRSFVGPGDNARDRSWSSDRVQREARPLGESSASKRAERKGAVACALAS